MRQVMLRLVILAMGVFCFATIGGCAVYYEDPYPRGPVNVRYHPGTFYDLPPGYYYRYWGNDWVIVNGHGLIVDLAWLFGRYPHHPWRRIGHDHIRMWPRPHGPGPGIHHGPRPGGGRHHVAPPPRGGRGPAFHGGGRPGGRPHIDRPHRGGRSEIGSRPHRGGQRSQMHQGGRPGGRHGGGHRGGGGPRHHGGGGHRGGGR